MRYYYMNTNRIPEVLDTTLLGLILFILIPVPHELGHYISCKMLGIEVKQIVIDYLNLTFRVIHEPIYNLSKARIVLVSGGALTALLYVFIHKQMKNLKMKHDWIPMVFSIYQILNAVAEGFFYQYYMNMRMLEHIILLGLSYGFYRYTE